ncbi:MAG: OmpA family protein [Tannerella sp.]|nr:OmpA family protein [Tannerella sp.]
MGEKKLIMLLCAVVVLSGCKAGKSAGKSETADNVRTVSVTGVAVGGAAGALIGKKMDRQKQALKAALPGYVAIEAIKKGEALQLTFASGMLFVPNSSTVTEAAQNVLHTLATNLNDHPDTGIKIIGHTDNTGQMAYNRILSEKRAKSVFDFLAAQGINAERMTYEGRGFREPAADNRTAEGRTKNRRVDIYLFANDKMVRDAHSEAAR